MILDLNSIAQGLIGGAAISAGKATFDTLRGQSVPALSKKVKELTTEIQGLRADCARLEKAGASKDETIAILNSDVRRRDELIGMLQAEKAQLQTEKAAERKERLAAQRKASQCERDCTRATKELRELKLRVAEDLQVHQVGIEIANARAGALETGHTFGDEDPN